MNDYPVPYYRLPPAIIDRWQTELGFDRAVERIYTSNLGHGDLPYLQITAAKYDGRVVSTVFTQDSPIQYTTTYHTTHHTDGFVFGFGVKKRVLKGNYLRVCYPYHDANGQPSDPPELRDFLVRLHLSQGREAAMELAVERRIHLPEQAVEQFSEGATVLRLGRRRQDNWFYISGAEAGAVQDSDFSLDETSQVLLELALSAQEPERMFQFLWMTIETQLGNGSRRRAFCESDLLSEKVSYLVKALHDTRSDYLHDGKIGAVTSDHIDCALAVIRVSALPAGRLRRNLVDRLESAYDTVCELGFGSNLSRPLRQVRIMTSDLAPDSLKRQFGEPP